MSDEAVSVGLAFDIDEGDLDAALTQYLGEVTSQMADSLVAAQELHRTMSSLVDPMRQLSKEADAFRSAMRDVKDLSSSIRQNLASTRLMTGQSMGAGGSGGGGALGGMGSMLSLPGMLSMAPGMMAAGGLAAFTGAHAFGGTSLGRGALDALEGAFSGANRLLPGAGNVLEALTGVITPALRAAAGPADGGNGQVSSYMNNGLPGVFQAMQAGITPQQMMQNVTGRQAAGVVGGGVGLMRAMTGGGGLVGMFSNFAGTQVGAQGGYDVGSSILGEGGGAVGAMLGGAYMPGFLQQHLQQGMAMYPGLLQTRASMASVGQYGGNLSQIQAQRPGQFGYGPGDIGPAFSSLYQGFGGGELTSDTLRTSMAYSRAYGVDMGAIGQSMGGLINVGGGGQNAGAGAREEIMARVMSDAIAEGFGRRLPEFAQAVGAGMQSVMSGPGLVGQEAMPGLISTMSRLTGRVASRHGLGLAGAGRMLAPIAGAPQAGLSGLLSGQGDYRTAMMWQTNRDRFGDDPYQMMFGEDGLLEATQNPFTPEALRFQQGPLEEIFRASSDPYHRARSVQALYPDMPAQGVRQIVEEGGRAFDEGGGSLAGVDMLEIFTGIEESQRTESEETRDVMRDIQASGEEIMRSQLGALTALAGFQSQQLGVAAAHAETASLMYRAQMRQAQISATLMTASGITDMLQSLNDAFSPEFAENLRNAGTSPEIVQTFLSRMLSVLLADGGVNSDELGRLLANRTELSRIGTDVDQSAARLQRRSGMIDEEAVAQMQNRESSAQKGLNHHRGTAGN